MPPLSESSPGSEFVVCHRPGNSVHCERIHPSSAARLGVERKMKSSGLRPMKRLPRAPKGPLCVSSITEKRSEAKLHRKACDQDCGRDGRNGAAQISLFFSSQI